MIFSYWWGLRYIWGDQFSAKAEAVRFPRPQNALKGIKVSLPVSLRKQKSCSFSSRSTAPVPLEGSGGAESGPMWVWGTRVEPNLQM